MKNKKIYRLVDAYDGEIEVGRYATLAELRQAVHERDKELDYEWYPVYYRHRQQIEIYL